MNQNERRRWLIHALLDEMPQFQYPVFPYTADRQWRLLRSLMNVRPPMPVSEEFLQIQDDFLKEMTEEKGIVDADSLPPCAGDPRLVLWQGDITTLRCDAIVNAANSQMLGCFSPCHGCIDNIIHTMSGVQLRLACHELMQKQGHEEPTGQAKITPGFNLPAKYVLHTGDLQCVQRQRSGDLSETAQVRKDWLQKYAYVIKKCVLVSLFSLLYASLTGRKAGKKLKGEKANERAEELGVWREHQWCRYHFL